MAKDSLNQFMAQFSEGGEFESAGVFTIDVEKAGDKVQRFQLVDPYLYIAHLVAAASLSGATSLRFSKTASEISVSFDGAPYDLTQLDNLSHGLLASYSGERRVQELAVAVMGARATEPEHLVWESVAPTGVGVRMSYLGDKRELEEMEFAPTGNRLVLKYPVTWKRIRGRFDTKSPEAEVLKNFCSRAPLRIYTDLGILNEDEFGPQDFLAWQYLRGTEIHAPLRVPSRRTGFCSHDSWQEPYSALLCLANPIYSEVHGLTIVLNGVTFRRAKVLGCPYACGIVFVSHLNKNLSHTDIVEDEAYHRLLDTLRATVDALWKQFANHNITLPHPLGDRVAAYLSRRYPLEGRPLDISSYLLRQELDKELIASDKGFEYLVEAQRFQDAEQFEQAAVIRTKVLESANRGLSRDYTKSLDKGSVKLAQLRAESAKALNKRPDPESEEIYRITAALFGTCLEQDGYPDEWSRLRAALIALATGQEDRVEPIASDLRSLEAWKYYLLGELNGDPELYYKAASLWGHSGFLWHEAASALLLDGQVEQGLECRIRGNEIDTVSPYFPHRLVREMSGKSSFLKWVTWSLKAKFSSPLDPKVVDVEGALQRNRILPKYALETLDLFALRSKEHEYLTHCILWSWRAHGSVEPPVARQFLAKTLLRWFVEVGPRAARITSFKR